MSVHPDPPSHQLPPPSHGTGGGTARQPPPPFDGVAARRLRQALGMAPGHVAYGIRASYGMDHITPDTIMAWETGSGGPSAAELTALAGALWCAPADLLGSARTVREHRLARGLAPEDVAAEIGMDPRAYQRMEDSAEWRGNERQSAALAEVLRLTPADFVAVTGRAEQLAGLLRDAVTATRWEVYVRPVSDVLPLHRGLLEEILQVLHSEYQGRRGAASPWDEPETSEQGAAGQEFLADILDRFWTLAGTAGR